MCAQSKGDWQLLKHVVNVCVHAQSKGDWQLLKHVVNVCVHVHAWQQDTQNVAICGTYPTNVDKVKLRHLET